MASRYLSIDDILAEEERVPAEMNIYTHRLGALDTTNTSTDLEAGAIVEMPLWLADKLASKRFASIGMPRAYNTKTREALLAAPEKARLREKSPYFYEVGLRLAATSSAEDARALPSAIKATLALRMSAIITRSQNSGHMDPSKVVEPLTELEQRLFWTGYQHTQEKQAWRLGSSSRITSPLASASAAGSGSSAAAAAAGVGDVPEHRSILGGAYKRKRNAAA